jgi:small-conductance mechanosensitive channel/CRP-like cAMP-binding protein
VTFLDALWSEAVVAKTPWLVALFVLTRLLVRSLALSQVRVKATVFFVAMHLLTLLLAAGLVANDSPLVHELQVPCWVFGAVAILACSATLTFDVLLPRMRLRTPPIVQDVLVAILAVVTAIAVLSRAGVNLSGLIATSAVFTAVLGFSLQDVIGNIAGGLALQVDNTIEVGDWIKIGDVTGKVTEVRWRCTAIETRNWETVLVPNASFVKSQVTVLGRRQGQPRLWRRWVHFRVDWDHHPSEVVDVVQKAVRGARIERVAADPPPNVVFLDMADSCGRYALRYWLTDLAADDPTDSEVRTRIFFALQRAGMSPALPAQSVFVTQESGERDAARSQVQVERRRSLLRSVALFATLSDAERDEVAGHLRYTPFTSGEVMTRQGAEAHWLYIIEDGTASVRVSDGKAEREVARLARADFFGEMSLLTGEPRSATVVADGDVECFRLDKAEFRRVLESRPELAHELAEILSMRRVGLIAAREGLDAEAARLSREHAQRDIFDRIRRFFSLG